MSAFDRMTIEQEEAAKVEQAATALAREMAKIDVGEGGTARRQLYEDAFRAGYLIGYAAAQGRRNLP